MASKRCRGGCSAGYIKRKQPKDYTKGKKRKPSAGGKIPGAVDLTATLAKPLPKRAVLNGKK